MRSAERWSSSPGTCRYAADEPGDDVAGESGNQVGASRGQHWAHCGALEGSTKGAPMLNRRTIAGVITLLFACTLQVTAAQNLQSGTVSDQGDATARAIERDVNQRDPLALQGAVQRGDLAAVNALLDRGVNPNRADRYGTLPLTLACLNGDAPIVE